eukprot:751849-Hanusia_phi.AAC.1
MPDMAEGTAGTGGGEHAEGANVQDEERQRGGCEEDKERLPCRRMGGDRNRGVPARACARKMFQNGLARIILILSCVVMAEGENVTTILNPTGRLIDAFNVTFAGAGFESGGSYSCAIRRGGSEDVGSVLVVDLNMIICYFSPSVRVPGEWNATLLKGGKAVQVLGSPLTVFLPPKVDGKANNYSFPALDCKGSCWPIYIPVQGEGILLSERDMFACGLASVDDEFHGLRQIEMATSRSAALSSIVQISEDGTLTCAIGTADSYPQYSQGRFKLVVTYQGRPVEWDADQLTVVLREAWTYTSCDASSCALSAIGGTEFHVYGFGFSSNTSYSCKFSGDGVLVTGQILYVSQVQLTCVAPARSQAASQVFFSLQSHVSDQVLFAGSSLPSFRYFAVWWFPLTPAFSVLGAPDAGWTTPQVFQSGRVVINGVGFNLTITYVAHFIGRDVNGERLEITQSDLQLVSESRMLLKVPQYHGPEALVLVSLYACASAQNCELLSSRYDSNRFRFVASVSYITSKNSALCYPQGSYRCWSHISDPISITVTGQGFNPSYSYPVYRCRFSSNDNQSLYVLSDSVEAVDQNTIVCSMPAWPFLFVPRVELTIYSMISEVTLSVGLSGLNPRYYFLPVVTQMAPSSAPSSAALITLSGFGFARNTSCFLHLRESSLGAELYGFRTMLLPAQRVSPSTLTCDLQDRWGIRYPSSTTDVYVIEYLGVGLANPTHYGSLDVSLSVNFSLPDDIWPIEKGMMFVVGHELMTVRNVSSGGKDFLLSRTCATCPIGVEDVYLILPSNASSPFKLYLSPWYSIGHTDLYSAGGTLLLEGYGMNDTKTPETRSLASSLMNGLVMEFTAGKYVAEGLVYGVLFDLYSKEYLYVNGFDLVMQAGTGNVWVYTRKCECSLWFNELNLDDWQLVANVSVEGNENVHVSINDVNISANGRRGFMILSDLPFGYARCESGYEGCSSKTWEDDILRLEAGLSVSSPLDIAGAPAGLKEQWGDRLSPRFFIGHVNYTVLLGDAYVCELANDAETAYSDCSRAMSSAKGFERSLITCNFQHLETAGTFNLRLLRTTNGVKEYLDAPTYNVTVKASWILLQGNLTLPRWGGFDLTVYGFGFSMAGMKCRFSDDSFSMETDITNLTAQDECRFQYSSAVSILGCQEGKCIVPQWPVSDKNSPLTALNISVVDARDRVIDWSPVASTFPYTMYGTKEEDNLTRGCGYNTTYYTVSGSPAYTGRAATLYEVWSFVTPSQVPATGEENVYVSGYGFNSTGQYICAVSMLGNTALYSSMVVNQSFLRCNLKDFVWGDHFPATHSQESLAGNEGQLAVLKSVLQANRTTIDDHMIVYEEILKQGLQLYVMGCESVRSMIVEEVNGSKSVVFGEFRWGQDGNWQACERLTVMSEVKNEQPRCDRLGGHSFCDKALSTSLSFTSSWGSQNKQFSVRKENIDIQVLGSGLDVSSCYFLNLTSDLGWQLSSLRKPRNATFIQLVFSGWKENSVRTRLSLHRIISDQPIPSCEEYGSILTSSLNNSINETSAANNISNFTMNYSATSAPFNSSNTSNVNISNATSNSSPTPSADLPAFNISEIVCRTGYLSDCEGKDQVSYDFLAEWYFENNDANAVQLRGYGIGDNFNYTCHFHSKTAVDQSELNVTSLKCSIPADFFSLAYLNLSVTSSLPVLRNGISESAETFYFGLLLDLTSSSQLSGPASGGSTVSVRGYRFSATATYVCLYSRNLTEMEEQGSYVDDGLVLCPTPVWGREVSAMGGRVNLDLLYEGFKFPKASRDFSFEFYMVWNSSYVSLEQASVKGGSILELRGYGFYPDLDYFCLYEAFQTTVAVRAEYTSVTSLTCPTPVVQFPSTSVTVSLSYSFNGTNVSIPQLDSTILTLFLYEYVDSVTPASGWAKGGQVITVLGQGFVPDADYKCKFVQGETVIVQASVVSTTELVCNVTAWDVHETVSIEVWKGSTQKVHSALLSFTFLQGWDRIEPALASARGTDNVTIYGYGFDARPYLCRFSVGTSNLTSEAASTSHDVVVCPIPAWGVDFPAAPNETISLELLQDSQVVPFTNSGLDQVSSAPCEYDACRFLVCFEWVAYNVGSDNNEMFSGGSASDGKLVTVHGFGFSQEFTYTCEFTVGSCQYQEVGKLLSVQTMSCFVPALASACPAGSGTLRLLLHPLPSLCPALSVLSITYRPAWSSLSTSQLPASGTETMFVYGYGFAASSTYQCKYVCAGQTVLLQGFWRATTMLECKSPQWNFAATTCSVAVVQDSQVVRFVPFPPNSSDVIFLYPCTDGAVAPASFSSFGGSIVTIYGFGFNTDVSRNYLCFFSGPSPEDYTQARATDANTIICRVPALWGLTRPSGQVHVRVTENLVPLACINASRCSSNTTVGFESLPLIKNISISTFSASGGETLTIAGYGFGYWPTEMSLPERLCIFRSSLLQGAAVVKSPITVISPSQMECQVPEWNYSVISTGVLQIQQQDTYVTFASDGQTSAPFVFEAVWSYKNVSQSLAKGGYTIRVEGVGFRPEATYLCVFEDHGNSTSSTAQFIDTQNILCRIPSWVFPQTTATFSVYDMSGGRKLEKLPGADDSLTFYQSWDAIASSVPVDGLASGNEEVLLEGFGFVPSGTYRCVFRRYVDGEVNETMSVEGRPVSPTAISCQSPVWGSQYVGFQNKAPSELRKEGHTAVLLTMDDVAVNFTNRTLDAVEVDSFSWYELCTSVEQRVAQASRGSCIFRFLVAWSSQGSFPSSFSAAGGEVIQVNAYGLSSALEYLCVFYYHTGDVQQYSTFSNDITRAWEGYRFVRRHFSPTNLTSFQCTSPAWNYQHVDNATLEVRIQDEITDVFACQLVRKAPGPPMFIEFRAGILSVSPTSLPTLGGLLVTITGFGFGDERYICDYGGLQQTDAIVSTCCDVPQNPCKHYQVLCVVDDWRYDPGLFNLSVIATSLSSTIQFYNRNGEEFLAKEQYAQAVDFYTVWNKTTPTFFDRLGGIDGGRSPALTVTGRAFYEEDRYFCVIGNSLDESALQLAQNQSASNLDDLLASYANVVTESVQLVYSSAYLVSRTEIVCIPPVWDNRTLWPYAAFPVNLSIVVMAGTSWSVVPFRTPLLSPACNQQMSMLESAVVDAVHINKPPQFYTKGNIFVPADSTNVVLTTSWIEYLSAGNTFDGQRVDYVESPQTLTFSVQMTTNEQVLFALPPSITSNGTLQFRAQYLASGRAEILVQLKDNGGVEYGGYDQSSLKRFFVSLIPQIDIPTFQFGGKIVVHEAESSEENSNFFYRIMTDLMHGPYEFFQQMSFKLVPEENEYLFDLTITSNFDYGTGLNLFFRTRNFTFGNTSVEIVLNSFDLITRQSSSLNKTFQVEIISVNTAPSFQLAVDLITVNQSSPRACWQLAHEIFPGPSTLSSPTGPKGEDWYESAQELTFEITGGEGDCFASLLENISIANDGTFCFTPVPRVIGHATCSLTLYDNGGTLNGGRNVSETFDFTVEVVPVNDEPYFSFNSVACENSTQFACIVNDTYFEVRIPSTFSGECSGSLCQGCSYPILISNFAKDVTASRQHLYNERNQLLTFDLVPLSNVSLLYSDIQITNTDIFVCMNKDAVGSDDFEISLWDDGGSSNGGVNNFGPLPFKLSVYLVNSRPSFDRCNNGSVTFWQGSGQHIVPSFIYNLDNGIGKLNDKIEADQIVTFTVIPTFDDQGLIQVPLIYRNGTLGITVGGSIHQGNLSFDVKAQDNGGTEGGGQDTTFSSMMVYVAKSYQIVEVRLEPTADCLHLEEQLKAELSSSDHVVDVLVQHCSSNSSCENTLRSDLQDNLRGLSSSNSNIIFISTNCNPTIQLDLAGVFSTSLIGTAKFNRNALRSPTFSLARGSYWTYEYGEAALPDVCATSDYLQVVYDNTQMSLTLKDFIRDIIGPIDIDIGTTGDLEIQFDITPIEIQVNDISYMNETDTFFANTSRSVTAFCPIESNCYDNSLFVNCSTEIFLGKAQKFLNGHVVYQISMRNSDLKAVFNVSINPVNQEPRYSMSTSQIQLHENVNSVLSHYEFAHDVYPGPLVLDELQQHLTFQLQILDGSWLFDGTPTILIASHRAYINFSVVPFLNGAADMLLTLYDDGEYMCGKNVSTSSSLAIQVLPVNQNPFFELSCSLLQAADCENACDQNSWPDFTSCTYVMKLLQNCINCPSSGSVTCPTGKIPFYLPEFAVNVRTTGHQSSSTDPAIQAIEDESDQTVTFSVSGIPSDLISDLNLDAQGNLQFCVRRNYVGSEAFTINLLDSQNGVYGPADLTVQVQRVNQQPSFSVCNDGMVNVWRGTREHQVPNFVYNIFKGQNEQGDVESFQTITFFVTDFSDSSIINTTTLAVTADGRLSFEVLPDAFGVVHMTIYAVDNGGTSNGGVDTSVSHTIQISVIAFYAQLTKAVPGACPEVATLASNLSLSLNFVYGGGNDVGAISLAPTCTGIQQTYYDPSNCDYIYILVPDTISQTRRDTVFTWAAQNDWTASLFDYSDNRTAFFQTNQNYTACEFGSDLTLDHLACQSSQNISVTFDDADQKMLVTVSDIVSNVVGPKSILVNEQGQLQLSFQVSTVSGVIFDYQSDLRTTDTSLITDGNHLFDVVCEQQKEGSKMVALGCSRGSIFLGKIEKFVNGRMVFEVQMNGTEDRASFQLIVSPINQQPYFEISKEYIEVSSKDIDHYVNDFAVSISPAPQITTLTGKCIKDEYKQNVIFRIVTIDIFGDIFSIYPSIVTQGKKGECSDYYYPNGTLTFSLNNGQEGNATLEVVASDCFDSSANCNPRGFHRTNFTIVVHPVLRPTCFILNSHLLQAQQRGTPQVFWAHGLLKDEYGTGQSGSAIFAVSSYNEEVITDAHFYPNGSLMLAVTPYAFGTFPMVIRLDDPANVGQDGTDCFLRNFTLDIAKENFPPYFTLATSEIQICENLNYSEVILENIATSKDTAASDGQQDMTFCVVVLGDEENIFKLGPSASVDGTFSFQPKLNYFGRRTVNITLIDAGSCQDIRSASQTYQIDIIITANNDPPSFELSRSLLLVNESSTEGDQIEIEQFAVNILKGLDMPYPYGDQQQNISFHMIVLDVSIPSRYHTTYGTVDMLLVDNSWNIRPDGTLEFQLHQYINGKVDFKVYLLDDGSLACGGNQNAPQNFTFTLEVLPVNQNPKFEFSPLSVQQGGEIPVLWLLESGDNIAREEGRNLLVNVTPGEWDEGDQGLIFQVDHCLKLTR